MSGLILTGDAAREAERGLTRQQRRAAERAANKTRTAEAIVDRALTGYQAEPKPGEERMLVGEEQRPAKMGDVIKLLEMALIEYDRKNQVDVVEFIEYRLSAAGRWRAFRSRWKRRLAPLLAFIEQIAAALDPAPGETMDGAELERPPFLGCLRAGEETDGRFYCTREAEHDGPCAAVPVDGVTP